MSYGKELVSLAESRDINKVTPSLVEPDHQAREAKDSLTLLGGSLLRKEEWEILRRLALTSPNSPVSVIDLGSLVSDEEESLSSVGRNRVTNKHLPRLRKKVGIIGEIVTDLVLHGRGNRKEAFYHLVLKEEISFPDLISLAERKIFELSESRLCSLGDIVVAIAEDGDLELNPQNYNDLRYVARKAIDKLGIRPAGKKGQYCLYRPTEVVRIKNEIKWPIIIKERKGGRVKTLEKGNRPKKRESDLFAKLTEREKRNLQIDVTATIASQIACLNNLKRTDISKLHRLSQDPQEILVPHLSGEIKRKLNLNIWGEQLNEAIVEEICIPTVEEFWREENDNPDRDGKERRLVGIIGIIKNTHSFTLGETIRAICNYFSVPPPEKYQEDQVAKGSRA